jgi:predicted alpha/beta superfamily hydrolase
MFKQIIVIAVCLLSTGNFLLAQNKKRMMSKQVQVIDTAFYMPQLNRYRRIWVYLPEDYTSNKKKYPVIYLQDGQNLFDEATSFAGEWSVDESMDSLSKTLPQSIVVGIDNGGDKRMTEYNPYDHPQFGKGEGILYLDFLVHNLKPFIDKHYRTKKSSKYTTIGGSSLGGLISLYAILQYPGKFGNAAVFSPALWMAPQLKEDIKKMGKKVKGRIYFYAGKQEGDEMVPHMLTVLDLLNRHSKAKITTVIRDGKHDEKAWRNEFPHFYYWLIEGSGTGK